MTANQKRGKLGPAVLDVTCSRCRDEGKSTYRTKARCTNCGWEGEADHSLTHEKNENPRARCPVCECKTVRMGEFVGSGGS